MWNDLEKLGFVYAVLDGISIESKCPYAALDLGYFEYISETNPLDK